MSLPNVPCFSHVEYIQMDTSRDIIKIKYMYTLLGGCRLFVGHSETKSGADAAGLMRKLRNRAVNGCKIFVNGKFIKNK